MPSRRPPAPILLLLALLLCALLAPSAARARRSEERSRRGAVEGETTTTGEPAAETTTPATAPGGDRTRRERLASKPRGCSVSAATTTTRIPAGQTVALSGDVTCASGDLDETTVTVYERTRGDAGLTEVATAQLDEEGHYEATTEPISSNCVLLVRAASGRGARVAIKVSPSVTLEQPTALASTATNAKAAGRWTFAGTVTPAAAGTRVALQRRYGSTGERWRTFAFARVGEEGQFSIDHRLPADGEVSLRALARPKGDTLTASATISFDVPGAQNAQLTILSSAEPAVAGATVTISGVAVGPVGTPLTLSARTHGHPFTTLATGASEAGGAYSFEVTPSVDTTYRVSDSTGVSAALFEGVTYTLVTTPPPGTVTAGEKFTVTGTALPALLGTHVRLERRNSSGLGFHPIAAGTTAADGSYAIEASLPLAGSYVLRVNVPATVETLGASGEPFTVAITAAP